ncbi:amidase [Acuticoccus sediminis]|uniref:Indoleacetamide hydrolase n=1 Tax=Acuticoccus sediminis TaxID=2184697 RepID=A0A8B2NG08_9HYPH|nr:amidase family protein [Acuticoccus sediminis]RAH97819.1 amidase [Acuticoccus sediminis]
MTDLADLTATELAAGYRAGTFSPVEVVDAALARIEARADLNAFITVTADEARAAAREAEEAMQSGSELPPLFGLPYSVKDLTLTKGVRTTFGSRAYADNVPDEDAVAVARAREAGAILLGKTTTPEFGHKIHTSAPLFGRTLNPHSPDVTPGGSSGGAAVAVAAGMGPIALGTDGGGSVRIPSACCGTVGFKPTLGTIPNLQAGDLFSSNVHVAPMARTVADTALLFEAVAGFDRRDPYGQANLPFQMKVEGLAGLRVAWLPSAGNPVDDEIAEITGRVVTMMADAGAIVDEIELDFASLEETFMFVLETLLASRARPILDKYRDQLDPTLLVHVDNGFKHSALELTGAGAARTRAFKAVQKVFEWADVIVSPTLSAPPLPHEQDPHGPVVINGKPAGRVRAAWYPYTLAFNLTGHPAISIPCGWTASGLPVGFHLAAPWYQERALLAVAADLEARLAVGAAQEA